MVFFRAIAAIDLRSTAGFRNVGRIDVDQLLAFERIPFKELNRVDLVEFADIWTLHSPTLNDLGVKV
ncbi:hypothetical protein D3C79_1019780 [compost metagenome]